MRRLRHALRALIAISTCAVLLCSARKCDAQTSPVERTFAVSKDTVEKALQQLRPAMSGRLPVLEGFAVAGKHPLSHYERAFYQCTVQVAGAGEAMPSDQLVVRVSAKVTAWYEDPGSAHSGYELIKSNGRIEQDLLDRLAEQLQSSTGAEASSGKDSPAADMPKRIATDEPTLSAPMPQATASGMFASPIGERPSDWESRESIGEDAKPSEKSPNAVEAETASLEEVLKNQAHPKNLVAVKKSGTPVVASPSLTAKTLFLASMHDEFEMLDFSGDWVHVRISGLQRGWIWRTSLEMPEGISDVPETVASSAPAAAAMFLVSREETAPFPGDWEPLRGKRVKIISVQKTRENEREGGPQAKLAFAKSLLEMNYAALANSPDLSGLVLIFDSADGGMIAVTMPTLQRWKAGKLTDSALWHQCYFDPPETFTLSDAWGIPGLH